MFVTIQFKMADNLNGKVNTVLEMKELLHEHLCLAIHEMNKESRDWLWIQTEDIKVINQED